jgi:hypothetical protein
MEIGAGRHLPNVIARSLRQQTIPLRDDRQPSTGDQQIWCAQHEWSVAGLRFDTAGNESGESGPRWHESLTAAAGGAFVARHPVVY